MDAYDRALKLLAMREHSVKELKNKLVSKGYGKEEIEDAVQMLIGEGSLSDKRFAYAFVCSRLRRNPEGKAILCMRLKEKGVPSDIAASVLSECWEGGEYVPYLKNYAEILIRKKGIDGARAMLFRKGFCDSEIRMVLEDL